MKLVDNCKTCHLMDDHNPACRTETGNSGACPILVAEHIAHIENRARVVKPIVSALSDLGAAARTVPFQSAAIVVVVSGAPCADCAEAFVYDTGCPGCDYGDAGTAPRVD